MPGVLTALGGESKKPPPLVSDPPSQKPQDPTRDTGHYRAAPGHWGYRIPTPADQLRVSDGAGRPVCPVRTQAAVAEPIPAFRAGHHGAALRGVAQEGVAMGTGPQRGAAVDIGSWGLDLGGVMQRGL